MRVVGFFVAAFVAAVCVAGASASPSAKRTTPFAVGFVDEGFTLYGDPDTAFSTLGRLGAQVIRVNHEQRFCEGGADPRGDGAALGY